MKKWISFSLSLLLLCFSSAWATTNNATAKEVIENWFAAMKNQQITTAADYLAPQFVSIHTDGIVRNKEQEIALIKNLHMQEYHLSHFQFSQSGDIITVTYKDDGVEKIDNRSIATKPAGRMAVLQKQKDKWLIIAYANLDTLN